MKVTPTGIRILLEGQRYLCALTGRELTPENCALDHRIPFASGGKHEIENVQLVVDVANRAKGTMSQEEFIELCRDVVKLHGEKDARG